MTEPRSVTCQKLHGAVPCMQRLYLRRYLDCFRKEAGHALLSHQHHIVHPVDNLNLLQPYVGRPGTASLILILGDMVVLVDSAIVTISIPSIGVSDTWK